MILLKHVNFMTGKVELQTYLQQQLNDKTYIQLDGEDFKIENYKIENYCVRVEKHINEEIQEEEYIIHSNIRIVITKNGNKENISTDVQVRMDEVFEIYELTFEPGLY
jgi:hypothetical protein